MKQIDPQLLDLGGIRKWLGVSQDDMARLLWVSHVSVARWERGHSAPVGLVVDVYLALETARKRGVLPAQILCLLRQDRGVMLRDLFALAYDRKTP